jgi:hypothetical protein
MDNEATRTGAGPTVNIKLIKNTKSYGWEVKAQDCGSVAEAMALLKQADTQLRIEFGDEGKAL